MKTKLTFGWIFVITGTLFLACGLFVMIFATLQPGTDGSLGTEIGDPSLWVSFANTVMTFVIKLLEVEWTRARVGVFLVVIGILMDGGGAYLMLSSEAKSKRSRGRSKNKK